MENISNVKDIIDIICSILSVLIVSVAGIFISIKANTIAEKQTQIMVYEKRAIINAILDDDFQNGIMKVNIINNGFSVLDTSIEVFSYYEVLCNENKMGSIPIRIYIFNGYIDKKYNDKQSGQLANITCYTEENEKIKVIGEEFHNIRSQFTNLYWDVVFTTIIKISTVNIFNETEDTYYTLNRWGMDRCSLDKGSSIYNEFTAMTYESNGTGHSVESFYLLSDLDGEKLLKASLEKLRVKKLYAKDSKTYENVTYGEYEPSE